MAPPSLRPRVLLRSEESDGRVSAIENIVGPDFAGFELHFARVAAEQAGVETPDWARQPIPEVTRVGPRIGEGAE
jgi:hypothetical protein